VPKLIIKRLKKVGLPPGTPVYVGEKKIDRARIKIIDYDEAQFQEKEAKTVEECFPFKDKPTAKNGGFCRLHLYRFKNASL